MYPIRFIEAVANSVKRTRSHLSIGESRLSAAPAYRSGQHENDVDAKKESNAFFKHLRLFHPDTQGGIENFDIRVNSVHKKPITRRKTEVVKIVSSTATNLLNSKAEHRQPALLRVRMVQGDDNDVQGPRHEAGRPGTPCRKCQNRCEGHRSVPRNVQLSAPPPKAASGSGHQKSESYKTQFESQS